MIKGLFIFITCLMIGLISGTAEAKWSLLEDFQLHAIAGDEGLCFSSRKEACDFDRRQYSAAYPEDELKDDMDESREDGLAMIANAFAPRLDYIPFPVVAEAPDGPVFGEPFFQSPWYTPGFSAWGKLAQSFLDALPTP